MVTEEDIKQKNEAMIEVSDNFARGMVAFLDTELEYIAYLRERNGGGTGVGGFGGGRGDQTQFDYAKKFKRKDKNRGIPLLRPRRVKPGRPKGNVKRPRNYRRFGDKIKNFKNLRNNRKIIQQLYKVGLRGDQIDLYRKLTLTDGLPSNKALKIALNSNPGGNVITRNFRKVVDLIPNRPENLTRLNMGGDLSKAGNNFFTRGLRPGNFSETGDALRKTVVTKYNETKNLVTKTAQNVTSSAVTKLDEVLPGTKKLLTTNADELMALALPAFKKFYKTGAGRFIKRIPFGVGALIDYVILTAIFKEDPGRAAFRAAGSTLGAWLGGAAGAAGGAAIGGVGAVIAGPAGAIAGGMLGDWLGGVIYDKTLGKEDEETVDEELSIEEQKRRRIAKQGYETDEELAASPLLDYKEGGVGYGSTTGAVITSPTRGMFGGMGAMIGEANDPEIIIPMSKIGDAISAVYREGASIMVGATLAFLGPLAGGNPAAASVLGEARQIASVTGADKSILPLKVKLPNMQQPSEEKENKKTSIFGIFNNKENVVTKNIQNNKDQSLAQVTTNKITSSEVTGQARWKTILPQGDPLFSSPFGPRWGRMHRGIDIGVWENSPVHAQEDGVVESIIPVFGEYGGAVVVSHQDGTANLYGHVTDYVVEKGQKVKRGDQLAKIIYYPGRDGSNQSHLHFERFNKSGTRIDPLPYFSQGGAYTPPAKEETKIDSVNQGGPNLRNISSNFVNLGSQTKQNNQQLIDTPVNITNTSRGTLVKQIPIPSPYPVTVIKKEFVPVEDTTKEQRMVIDVFGKGAGRR